MLKKIFRIWMCACTAVITLGLLGGGAYFLIKPAMQSKDFKAIDECIDSSGAWNDEQKICIHNS